MTLVVALIELQLTLVEPQPVQWVRVPAPDSHNTLLNHMRAEVATCHQVPVRYCKLAAMVYYMPVARHFVSAVRYISVVLCFLAGQYFLLGSV